MYIIYMPYNAADHAEMLKEITPIFNDIWKYVRFSDHPTNDLAGIDDGKINTAKKIYDHLNTIEHDVFMRIHTQLKTHTPVPVATSVTTGDTNTTADPVPDHAATDHAAVSSGTADPAADTLVSAAGSAVKTSKEILSNTNESNEACNKITEKHNKKLEYEWWTHTCIDEVATCGACTTYTNHMNTTGLKEITTKQWYKYKNNYKQDRAAYNSTLTHGLHVTSPIIWYAHNYSHYAYVMQMFYKYLIKSGGKQYIERILTHFTLVETCYSSISLSYPGHISNIKESIEYATAVLSGHKVPKWYNHIGIKSVEHVMLWILIITIIVCIIIVSIDIANVSNNIIVLSNDISSVAKEWVRSDGTYALVNLLKNASITAGSANTTLNTTTPAINNASITANTATATLNTASSAINNAANSTTSAINNSAISSAVQIPVASTRII